MSNLFNIIQSNPIFQLLLAAGLGGLIGWEREQWKKAAGLRTHTLVSLGAALFTILSREAFDSFFEITNYDPSRIAAQIITGIGFLGAGVIILRRGRLEGITTAAGLWVAAAVGMAVGCHFYGIAIFTAVFTFVILWSLRFWIKEEKSREKRR